MGFTCIPGTLAEWVAAQNLSPYTLMAILTLVYILLGTALDGVSMIVLTTVVVIVVWPELATWLPDRVFGKSK